MGLPLRKIRRAHSKAELSALLFLLILPSFSFARSVSEQELKAAFLFNFLKFVTYPEKSPLKKNNSFVICNFRENTFEGHLKRLLKDQRIGGKHVLEKTIGTPESANSCHLLFFPKKTMNLPFVINDLTHRESLTVGESDEFLKEGGMIQLFIQNKRVRFSINTQAIQQAHLSISSNLLRLADRVYSPEKKQPQ